MKAFGWQDVVWAVAATGGAVAVYFLLRTPEPARTGLALVAAVCGAPEERRELLVRHVAEPLDLDLGGPGDASGRGSHSHEQLAAELGQLDALIPECAFSLNDWRLRSASDGSEWLEGVLEYSDSQPSDLHGQRRALRASFRQVDGEWRVERVLLGRNERRLPEARP